MKPLRNLAVAMRPFQWIKNLRRDQKTLLTIIIFIIIGIILVRSSASEDSITWMYIYQVSDFTSIGEISNYIKNLRVPIPIVISLAEIIDYNIFGNTHLITVYSYRLALIFSFVLSIYMASSSDWKIKASFVLSVVFLWSAVIIHPGNPQTYDIFFPFFIMLHIFFLDMAVSRSFSSTKLALICFASGFFLTMAELTRPFVFFLLPLLIFTGYQAMKSFRINYFIYFLIPVVIFSGGWHLHLALHFGQATWTNHSGFNLYRAWPKVKLPPLVEEIHNQPLKPDRWPNLNTAEHYENSRRIQKAVVKYIVIHQKKCFKKIGLFFIAKTGIYSYQPHHVIFWVYKPFVFIALSWLTLNMLLVGIACVKHGISVLGVPKNVLIIIAVSYIIFSAIGEAGEEARFLISILPLIASLPGFSTSTKLAQSK